MYRYKCLTKAQIAAPQLVGKLEEYGIIRQYTRMTAKIYGSHMAAFTRQVFQVLKCFECETYQVQQVGEIQQHKKLSSIASTITLQ